MVEFHRISMAIPVTCYINTQHCIFQDPGSLVVFQAPQLLVEDMLQSFFLRLDVGLYIYTVYVCICVYIYMVTTLVR